MSQYLCETILFVCRSRVRALGQTCNVSSLRTRWFCISSDSEKEHSFVISYLINSLGFSPKNALSASRRVNFESPEKPDRIIKFFKGYGFTDTQISSLVRAVPPILLANAEKTILPKLDFLVSKGISVSELAKVLSVYPLYLRRSLAEQIIPSYEFFRNLLQSDRKAITAIKRHPNILLAGSVKPNIYILRDHGVPYSNIAVLILQQPKSILLSSDKFRKIVEEVVAMGFSASKLNFVYAVAVFRAMNRSKGESKVNAFKKWGWSDEDVSKAFQREPRFMRISEDKISKCMDFFTNKLGWSHCNIVKNPIILTYSLEKRVMPRCLVYQQLISKGLLKEVSLSGLSCYSEKTFLEKFVTCYKEDAPELLNLYEENLNLSNGARKWSSTRCVVE